jgi:drug/metabolite transporter (DMT)-like permease
MGQLGEQPGTESGQVRTAESVLQSVTQDLQNLQQGLIAQLSQEVGRLQAEKARLLTDIEKLQVYHRALQSRQLEALSQQQIAQQQVWAKQLAQLLATHLQAQIAQRLNQMAAPPAIAAPPGNPASPQTALSHSDSAHRLLASLDSTFNSTFKTLQQELDSYQSSLSQQLNRMHSLEQQGEAILEELINRLREQLQTETNRSLLNPAMPVRESFLPPDSRPSPPAPVDYPPIPPGNGLAAPPEVRQFPPGNGYPPPPVHQPPTSTGSYSPPETGRVNSFVERQASTQVPARNSLTVPAAPLPLSNRLGRNVSQFQLGLVLVLISTLALSFHNVVVRIIGNGTIENGIFTLHPARVLGLFDVGGFLQLNFGNSLLILWLRMVVVLPLMVPVAMFLYPHVWRDINRFVTARDRRPLFNVLGSGFFLFLSQVLIYIAIGLIGAGPAVTILFMYPIITVPLAWFLFGDRPTRLRWIVMGVILLGVILTRFSSTKEVSGAGLMTAVGAGIAFALYLLLMQLGFKKLHPIPVSLLQFFTIFVLTSLILMFFPRDVLNVRVQEVNGFIVGGIVLGALTLVGYLTNNFGVRYMGAARASIVASSGPAITALLALVFIQDHLGFWQWLGILLVTGGVSALSFERMKTAPPIPSKTAVANGRRL